MIGAARPGDFDLAAEATQLLATPEAYRGRLAAIDGRLTELAVAAPPRDSDLEALFLGAMLAAIPSRLVRP